MGTTSQIFARRLGRIAFGLALLGGVVPLVRAAGSLGMGPRPFAPMLHAMQHLVDRERAEIRAAPRLPRAVASAPRGEA